MRWNRGTGTEVNPNCWTVKQLGFTSVPVPCSLLIMLFYKLSFKFIAAVAVAATGFQIAKLGELTQVAFGGGGGESPMTDDILGGELASVCRKLQNIDQFPS